MRPNNSHLFQVFGFHQSTGKSRAKYHPPCFPHAGLLQCTMSMPPTLGSSLIPGSKRWQQHSCLQELAPGWDWHPVLPWTLGKSECTLTHWDTLRISKLNQQLQWAKHNIRHRECVLDRIVFGICIWLVFFMLMKLGKTLSGIETSPESLLTIPRGRLASSAHYKHLCRSISCTDSLQISVRLMVEGKVTNMSAREERQEKGI